MYVYRCVNNEIYIQHTYNVNSGSVRVHMATLQASIDRIRVAVGRNNRVKKSQS